MIPKCATTGLLSANSNSVYIAQREWETIQLNLGWAWLLTNTCYIAFIWSSLQEFKWHSGNIIWLLFKELGFKSQLDFRFFFPWIYFFMAFMDLFLTLSAHHCSIDKWKMTTWQLSIYLQTSLLNKLISIHMCVHNLYTVPVVFHDHSSVCRIVWVHMVKLDCRRLQNILTFTTVIVFGIHSTNGRVFTIHQKVAWGDLEWSDLTGGTWTNENTPQKQYLLRIMWFTQ